MPWKRETDIQRFVVPEGVTAAEADIIRRQLQIMDRLDKIECRQNEQDDHMEELAGPILRVLEEHAHLLRIIYKILSSEDEREVGTNEE